jgi:hypothetical protein
MLTQRPDGRWQRPRKGLTDAFPTIITEMAAHSPAHGGRSGGSGGLVAGVGLVVGVYTHLCQLARQCGRPYAARTCRQYLGRWLDAPQWVPETLYAGLAREVRRVLRGRHQVPLLVDFTYLSHRWAVLQVSVGWQRRALPVYRAVFRRREPEVDQTTAVQAACAWLRAQLPGPAGRYIVVMDRGFPGHRLLNWLTAHSWRYVVRVSGKWRMQHPSYTGLLREAVTAGLPVGPTPRLFRQARWGRPGKGRDEWSVAHVVFYHGVGYQAPW